MSDADLGQLRPTGDAWELTFTRYFAHPPAEVWRAVTEPDHLAVWFPQQILGERVPGARLRFVTSIDPEDGFDGEMITFEPPHVMEMMWGPSRLRIEVHAHDGGTRLQLTEWLDDLGKGARNGAGWHECLDRLAAVIEATAPLRWGRRWHDVHPAYVETFGPEAARLEAPVGWDADLPDDPYAPRFPQYPDPTAPLGTDPP